MKEYNKFMDMVSSEKDEVSNIEKEIHTLKQKIEEVEAQYHTELINDIGKAAKTSKALSDLREKHGLYVDKLDLLEKGHTTNDLEAQAEKVLHEVNETVGAYSEELRQLESEYNEHHKAMRNIFERTSEINAKNGKIESNMMNLASYVPSYAKTVKQFNYNQHYDIFYFGSRLYKPKYKEVKHG